MSQSDHIIQPSTRTTLDALQTILQTGGVERIDAAVAYITSGGALDFVKRAEVALGGAWATMPKRWITSFDYCRTEPVALNYLNSVPNLSIRIHNAEFCLQHDCAPKVPFHPKTFLIRTAQRDFALVGSGNMSRSGLSRGIEAGLVLSVARVVPGEPTAVASMSAMRTWFRGIWHDAEPLTTSLLDRYSEIFERNDNLRSPIPTEDDVASPDAGTGSLSSKELQKLRVCRNFWIEAGNITKNRGPHLPGNQLMMKRLSRVFFGFPPDDLPKNSHIGDVQLKFAGGHSGEFSMTYSDNKMEKLVLPVPGPGAPSAYDNEYLLFRRWKPGVFELSIGTKAQKNQWLKQSLTIQGAFKMSSGRQWGVF
ncbi:hypothetical protein [Polaromonas sp. YR568]|uniref:hypothetical protein n=1 Tax=Polaromonas sp. YR568 TaxID=1855301 RepID=UPI00398BD712